MNMNNEALKALIAELGNRIFCIRLDDGHKLFIGVPREGDLVGVESLKFKTVNGVDMFGVTHNEKTWNDHEVPYTTWMVTSFIQMVYATEELTNELPDINKFF